MVHQTQHRSVYFYPPPSLPSLQTDFGSDTSSSNIDAFSPRTLYASFHRPDSSATMPPRTYKKKNMGEFTGFGITTEEEFEALPIAVRRKVCVGEFFAYSLFHRKERASRTLSLMRSLYSPCWRHAGISANGAQQKLARASRTSTTKWSANPIESWWAPGGRWMGVNGPW